jgi:hypothetical protein
MYRKKKKEYTKSNYYMEKYDQLGYRIFLVFLTLIHFQF